MRRCRSRSADVRLEFCDLRLRSNLHLGFASAKADRHPRWVCHFTPTSASWLNAVEGFFTKRRPKRGVFKSIADLEAAINRFLAETNDDPKPFIWTADPDQIIAAVRRGHHALDFIR